VTGIELLLLIMVSGYTAREVVTDTAAALRGQQRPSDKKWHARQQKQQGPGGQSRSKPGWMRTAWENANAEAAEKARHRHQARLAYIGQREPAKSERWKQRKLARAQRWDTAKDRLAQRARGGPDEPDEQAPTHRTAAQADKHASGQAAGRTPLGTTSTTEGQNSEHLGDGHPVRNGHDVSNGEGLGVRQVALAGPAAAAEPFRQGNAPGAAGRVDGNGPDTRNGSNGHTEHSDAETEQTGGNTMTTATSTGQPTGEAITIGQTRQAYGQFDQAAADAIDTAGEAASQAANLESAADLLVSSLTEADLDEQTLAEAASLREQAAAMRQAAEALQTAADGMSGTVKTAMSGLDSRHGLMEEAVQGTEHPAHTDWYRD
jgi:hypothetical protein